jgi:hypothetical protein
MGGTVTEDRWTYRFQIICGEKGIWEVGGRLLFDLNWRGRNDLLEDNNAPKGQTWRRRQDVRNGCRRRKEGKRAGREERRVRVVERAEKERRIEARTREDIYNRT